MRNIRYLALLLFALLTATACSDDDNGSGNNNKKGIRNTVVMYVSAENSLGYQKFHNSDSTEIMAGSQFLNSRDQMIMYVDDAQNPRIYRIYKGCRKPQLLKKFSTNLCSSDPETLRELLSWVKQTYPSERYGLVMWSHADGWLPSWNTDYKSSKSFGIDVGTGGDMKYDTDSRFRYGASMEIEDLARAVSESGMRPQYIFFDACLMQCIEVDYALRDVTDYVVACPISTPAIGANYTTLMRDGLFTGNPEDIADLEDYINDYRATINEEYTPIESDVQLYIEEVPVPDTQVPEEIQDNVVDSLMACQNGVMRMIPTVPDTVETSSNLAIVTVGGGKVDIRILARSSSDSMKEFLADSLGSCFSMAGMKVEFSGSYSGWQPNVESPILHAMKASYKQQFGVEPAVKVIHAGLECGIIGATCPGMDMVSFGPTLLSPHSPDERAYIPSVAKFYEFLVATLEQTPSK